MDNLTKNEMRMILTILKNPDKEYNARSISKELKITHMGALKIARRLEKENVLLSKELGKAKFYNLNFDDDYVRQYIKFLLKREAEQSPPYIKRWIKEVKKIRSADASILFGSVLKKQKESKDVDVLFITDKWNFSKLKNEINELNYINIKKLHPLYQTRQDIIENIKKGDNPLLSAIKGIVVFGEDIILEVLTKK